MKKRILILTDNFPPDSLGGAGKIAFWQSKELQLKDFDILVVTTTQHKEKEGDFSYEGLRVIKIYSNYKERWRAYVSLFNLNVVNKFDDIINEFKPDIVYAHNIHYYISYHCLKISKKFGARVFLLAHDTMSFTYGKLRTRRYLDEGIYKVTFWDNLFFAKKRFNPFRNFIIRRVLNKYVDLVLAVSNELKMSLVYNGIKNVVVLHNGVDVNYWDEGDNVNYYKDYYKLGNKKIVLFSARLSGGKGGEKIILAMGEVIKKVPNAVLLVLGERNQYAVEMDNLIKKINIHNNIVFTGWVDGHTLRAIYKISDVVCTPSVYLDPFPTVNLEAMACGKPIVGTCFGGTKELVLDKKSGYIVDPRDIHYMADKIVDLLENKDKAKEFGLYGKKIVEENFGLDSNVNKLINIFKK